MGKKGEIWGPKIVDFGGAAPKITHSFTKDSPMLTKMSRNQSKYAVTWWNQTYLSMTTRFAEHRGVFGKLLSDFWSNSLKTNIFGPQISPFLPTGASQNDRNQSKYAVTGWN